MPKTIKVKVPENVSHVADGRVYRAGEEFEADRKDVAQYIAVGHLVEVKKKK